MVDALATSARDVTTARSANPAPLATLGRKPPADPDPTGELMDDALPERGHPSRAAQENPCLNSILEHIGVPIPPLRRVAVGFAPIHPGLSREERGVPHPP